MDFTKPTHIVAAFIVFIAVFGAVLFFMNNNNKNDTSLVPASVIDSGVVRATIKTEKGNISLELYPKVAMKTVANFIVRARAGYFNGLAFHRVEDWVIQGGDPLSRDESQKERWGMGGGNIETELSEMPFVEGAVGVARGPDIKVSNDSQFFIVKKDSQFLNNQYTLFGQTVAGMDIVRKIQPGDKIVSIEIAE